MTRTWFRRITLLIFALGIGMLAMADPTGTLDMRLAIAGIVFMIIATWARLLEGEMQ